MIGTKSVFDADHLSQKDLFAHLALCNAGIKKLAKKDVKNLS